MEKKHFDKKMDNAYQSEIEKGMVSNLSEACAFKSGSDAAFDVLDPRLANAICALDLYLNAGSKETREYASNKAKQV